jgi:hypothetical protein
MAFLLALAAACACSSSNAVTPQTGSGGDAQPGDDGPSVVDAQGDAQPVDDATPIEDADADAGPDGAGATIWSAASTGFEIDSTGGLVVGLPDGSTCTVPTQKYVYDVASRELARTSCFVGQPPDATVILSPSSAAQLVAVLSGLTSKGRLPSGECGADAPAEVLTILGPDAGTNRYDSDFYTGCAGDQTPGPYVDHMALDVLISDLYMFVAGCGTADAAANCVTRDQ